VAVDMAGGSFGDLTPYPLSREERGRGRGRDSR